MLTKILSSTDDALPIQVLSVRFPFELLKLCYRLPGYSQKFYVPDTLSSYGSTSAPQRFSARSGIRGLILQCRLFPFSAKSPVPLHVLN